MAGVEPATNYDLPQDAMPMDQITSVAFGPTPTDPLLVSSLDGTVRFFDGLTGDSMEVHKRGVPILAACWLKSGNAYATAGTDGAVRITTYPDGESEYIGSSHKKPVKCLRYHTGNGILFSACWGGEIKAFNVKKKIEVASLTVPGKVFCMDVSEKGKKLIVGTSERAIHILDIKKGEALLDEIEETRPDIMKYQLRSIAAFPDGKGFAVASTEGRSSWEYFKHFIEQGQGSVKPYAFKCHREKFESDIVKEKIWPVNCLAFHSLQPGTFATGGSEGSVVIWDGINRKKLWKLQHNFKTSVTALAFCPQGIRLAMASSYDFVLGAKPPSRPQHNASDADVLNTIKISIRTLRPEEYQPRNTRV